MRLGAFLRNNQINCSKLFYTFIPGTGWLTRELVQAGLANCGQLHATWKALQCKPQIKCSNDQMNNFTLN